MNDRNRRKAILPRMILCLLLTFLLSGMNTVPIYAQCEVYRSVKNESKQIALTFDDGPHPRLTEQILNILDRYEIKATFFMVGVNVQNYSEAALEVFRRGHEIGNHTFSHPLVTHLSPYALNREIGACEDALEELCEYRPHLFRPPEGALTDSVSVCAEEGDYAVVLWSLDTRDWEVKNADRIVKTVLSEIHSGDIILMHDYIGVGSQTPQALEILIPTLLRQGYRFVTVSELLSD